MYVGGLFTGGCGTTHKARIPSTASLSLPGARFSGAALDMRRALYLQRWTVPASTGRLAGREETNWSVLVEQRTYAHRVRRHILVTEFEVMAVSQGEQAAPHLPSATVSQPLRSFWDPGNQSLDGLPGNDCAGAFEIDVAMRPAQAGLPGGVEAWTGQTTLPNDDGGFFNFSVVLDSIPEALTLPAQPGSVLRLVTAVVTSLDLPAGSGSADAVLQAAAAAWSQAASGVPPAQLLAEHEAAWASLWESGVGVEADAALPASHALEVASHANSSQYFLLSSVRPDWPVGVSPGGLSTANYNGAVFFDQDWYITPALRLLAPDASAALLQYRVDSLPAARDIAALFGYAALPGAEAEAAMFAWTSAYRGHAFSCCSGHGGYENCLEQHITGDVATAAWWEWLTSGDRAWLRESGWPVLAAVAEFWLARVTPAPPTAGAQSGQPLAEGYSVAGVLPVDEWCVDSGCGCETPGVTDDVQTNAVAALSLRYAMAAAQELGLASERTTLYGAVADRVRIAWNATAQRHNQWSDAPGSKCPGGIGGSNYSPDHTVCPEEVLYLSYPLAEAMNVSLETTRRDAERFIPITCQENAGMTTPIHTVTLLDLDMPAEAQAAFNRSLRAACYGPFNVRNEVDKHADIIGGHFDNTHFLTGDGGFLQAVVYGYGRLRIAEDGGLWVRSPVALPQGVGALTLRRLKWRAGAAVLNVVLAAAQSVTLSAEELTGLAAVCVRDALGATTTLHQGDSLRLQEPARFPAKILAQCP